MIQYPNIQILKIPLHHMWTKSSWYIVFFFLMCTTAYFFVLSCCVSIIACILTGFLYTEYKLWKVEFHHVCKMWLHLSAKKNYQVFGVHMEQEVIFFPPMPENILILVYRKKQTRELRTATNFALTSPSICCNFFLFPAAALTNHIWW